MNKIGLLRKLVYYAIVVGSVGFFVYTVTDVIIEFYQEKTGFNIVEHSETELELPAATVCVTDVFRNVNKSNAREILSNLTAFTFHADHIFYKGYDALKDWYTVQETFNYQNGHCFTVTTREKQVKNGPPIPILFLKLLKNHKYKISIHEPGAELWLQCDLKPSKIISFDVNGYELGKENVAYVRIELTQKKITNQNRRDYRCDQTQSLESFTQCSFDILGRILHHVNNCSAMIRKVNKTLVESRICQDMDNFTDIKVKERDLLENILVNIRNEECLRPCEKIEYSGSITKAHQNKMKLLPFAPPDTKQYVGIWIHYDDFIVQEYQEYFVLNVSGLVSSIGGFLGLFLGLSSMSFAEWIKLK